MAIAGTGGGAGGAAGDGAVLVTKVVIWKNF